MKQNVNNNNTILMMSSEKNWRIEEHNNWLPEVD